MWYAAHTVLYTRILDGLPSEHVCIENIYLIQAEASDEAFARADKIGRLQVQNESAGVTLEGCLA